MQINLITAIESDNKELVEKIKYRLGNMMHVNAEKKCREDYVESNVLLNYTIKDGNEIYLVVDFTDCKDTVGAIECIHHCLDDAASIYRYEGSLVKPGAEYPIRGFHIKLEILESEHQEITDSWIYGNLNAVFCKIFGGNQDYVNDAVIISDLPTNKDAKLIIALYCNFAKTLDEDLEKMHHCLDAFFTIEEFLDMK